MKETTKTAHSMEEMHEIIEDLVNSRFENLGSWEFYNKNTNEKVILKIHLGF